MIQDIEPKLNNQYKNIKPKDNDYVLSYSGRRVLLSKKAETLEKLMDLSMYQCLRQEQ